MPRRNTSGHYTPGRGLSSRARAMRGQVGRTVPHAMATDAVVCPHGKTGFTKAAAEERLARYSTQESNRERRPVRVYECPHCGHWHLTSRPESRAA